MKIFSRFTATVLGVVVLLGTASMASAQVPNLAFPPFNASQHVYKSRPLGSSPGYDLDIRGLDQRVQNAASGLRSSRGRTAQAYVLFLKEPDSGLTGQVPGGAAAATVFSTWK